MRKATKTIISFAVVLIAGLNLLVPAFAQDPFTGIAIGGLTGASGAGLFGSMAGMSGINISWSGQTADPMDAMWNVLNPDHVYFSGEKHEADPQTDPEDIWDYITVDLGDWLQAQQDFISNFASTYQVEDNDSGNTPNILRWENIPVIDGGTYYYAVGAYITGTGVYKIGGHTCTISSWSSGNYSYSIDGGTSFYKTKTSGSNLYLGIKSANKSSGSQVSIVLGYNDNLSSLNTTATPMGYLTYSSGVSYTSDTVNTHVFDGWEKAKVKIPHNISGLSPNWTIPEFLGAINNLWIQNQQGQIVIEDTDQPVPPPPIPTTPIGDVPFDNWVDLWGATVTDKQDDTNDKLDLIGSNGHDQLEELQDVNANLQDANDHLENIDTNLEDLLDHAENIDTNIANMADDVSNIDTNVADIDENVENIDTNVEDIEDIAESIDTNIGIGNGLLGDIKSLAQSAVDFLEDIAENVAELVESVVQATETLIAGILNQIPQVFSVIFGPIKQASSIWHYVVEWIQSISAPFQFIWSMASGTSYNIVLPVYASLAAAVVLAFYKRFGK